MKQAQTIILYYKRYAELVNNVHLFKGTLVLQDESGDLLQRSFDNLRFHQMIVSVSRELRANPNAAVVMRRTDRVGLEPVQIGEELRCLIRDDPVQAIRAMDIQLAERERANKGVPEPFIRAAFDTLADAFGERVYLKVSGGQVEDPITAEQKSFAFDISDGWKIRGDENRSKKWLPIRIEDVELPNIKDAEQFKGSMREVAACLASCRWVSVAVEDLLATEAQKFYIPRRWNVGNKWVSRAELQKRLTKYMKEKQLS